MTDVPNDRDASFLPSESFVGRQRVLQELESLLEHQSPGILLHGVPGSGKSYLLRYLMSKQRAVGNTVLWVSLSRVQKPSDLFAVIAGAVSELSAFDLTSDDLFLVSQLRRASPSASVASLLKLLRIVCDHSHGRTTLILDGLDETVSPSSIADIIDHLVSEHLPGFSLVVSSRYRADLERLFSSDKMSTIRLELDADDARALVNVFVPNAPLVTVDEIVRMSNGNPLVIRLLAEQLAESGVDWKKLGTPFDLQSIFQLFLTKSMREFGRDNVVHVLSVVALFQPVTKGFLIAVSGLSVEQVDTICSALNRVLRFEARNDTMSLFALSFREFIIKKYVATTAIDFAELDFGAEEAERDSYLDEGFLTTPSVDRILSGEKTIVIGDRGSGKSSIVRHLRQMDRRGRGDSVNVVATNDHVEFMTQHVATTPEASAEFFKAAWLLYLAAVAALQHQKSFNKERRRNARRILENVGWSEKVQQKVIRTRKVWQWVKAKVIGKMKFQVGPVTIEPDISTGGKNIDIREFLNEANEELATSNERVLILLDQLDQMYKYDRHLQERMIQGLFLAESTVAHLNGALRFVILLRTDLFEVFDIQEKNRLVSRTERLTWRRSELLQLLVNRLYSNPSLEQLGRIVGTNFADESRQNAALRLAFPMDVEGRPFQQWLLEVMRNGNGRVSPRQIVLFLILAKESVLSGEQSTETAFPLFTAAVTSQAMTTLSSLSYEEMINDFRVGSEFVRNCAAGKLEAFLLKDVQGLFSEEEGPVNEQREQLERLGFIERVVIDDSGTQVEAFRIPELYRRSWQRC